MEENTVQAKLQQLEQKIDAVYVSVEKTRKYFLWTMIGTIVTFVVPLIALVIAIPWAMNALLGSYKGLL